MKLPQLLTRKKLRAATARRALGPADMDCEEMSEPNMKLSRALLIVLVLHVVAVAGIIAFNTIKTQQGPPPSALPEVQSAKITSATSVKSESATTMVAVRNDEPRVAKALPKLVTKDDRKSDQVKPAENNSTRTDDGKTYVVAKGDNPVSIARKFKVPYDDLMAANNIEDPHKLKIGQKLIIPNKPTKSKKGD